MTEQKKSGVFGIASLRSIPQRAIAVLALLLLSLLTGCNNRSLSPELEYKSDNVRTLRKALEMPEGTVPDDHVNEEVNELLVKIDSPKESDEDKKKDDKNLKKSGKE